MQRPLVGYLLKVNSLCVKYLRTVSCLMGFDDPCPGPRKSCYFEYSCLIFCVIRKSHSTRSSEITGQIDKWMDKTDRGPVHRGESIEKHGNGSK